jgi:hypothetical protein
MRKLASIAATVMGTVVLSAAPISVKWSGENLSVTQDEAFAVIGRPLTPGSATASTEGLSAGRCDAARRE